MIVIISLCTAKYMAKCMARLFITLHNITSVYINVPQMAAQVVQGGLAHRGSQGVQGLPVQVHSIVAFIRQCVNNSAICTLGPFRPGNPGRP